MSLDDNQSKDGATQQDGVLGAVARFKELPKNAQLAIGGVVIFFVFMFLVRGGGSPQQVQPLEDVPTVGAINLEEMGQTPFAPVEAKRDSLLRGFVSQQQLALSDMRAELDGRMGEKEKEMAKLQSEISSQTQRMSQMIETFNEQMRTMEESNATYREEIARIAEEARRQGLKGNLNVMGDTTSVRSRKERISQTPLAMGGSGLAGQPLLGGITKTAQNAAGGVLPFVDPTPFIPPLGFVKGTLLNGVDALVGGSSSSGGGGMATPALVRLSGIYKTAMNSTVNLDGCFALVEFVGELSTERAMGKPSRMTCVYPDQGAVTYSMTGYVVDSGDGIVGVPGLFYEGDASRMVAAFVAEFVAGVAEVVKENQSTTTTSGVDGTATTSLTGSQIRAEMGGGIADATSNLQEYLMERSDRALSFIRIDSTRDIHLVLLSGTRLRAEGSPWTLLLSGEDIDNKKNAEKQAQQKAVAEANKQSNR